MLVKCLMMTGGVFQEPSLDAAQQMRNSSAKKFGWFQDLWQWLESNIPCTILIQEEECTFDEQTCFWILVSTCIIVLVGCPPNEITVVAYSGTL